MRSDILYIAIPILCAACLNVAIWKLKWSGRVELKNRFLPPGWVVGTTWMILLGLLGYTLARSTSRPASVAMVLLIAWCLAYPVVTLWISPRIVNTMSLIVTWAAALPVDANNLPYVAPILAWVSYVGLTDSISVAYKSPRQTVGAHAVS